MKYAVLVDGGGTSTKVCVAEVSRFDGLRFPSSSVKTHQLNWPLNVLTAGLDNVSTAFSRLSAECGINLRDIANLDCGLAGIDNPAIAESVRESINSLALPRDCRVSVNNDLRIGTSAVYESGKSAGVVIGGTGSNCAVENTRGQLVQIGGIGWIICDRGRCGSWLGGEALNWVVRELQRRSEFDAVMCSELQTRAATEPDILLSNLLRQLGKLFQDETPQTASHSQADRKLREWIGEKVYMIPESQRSAPDGARVRFLGQLARPAIEAANAGHPAAQQWGITVGHNLAQDALDAMRTAAEVPSRFAMVGGVIASRGMIRDAFRTKISQSLEHPPTLVPFRNAQLLSKRALDGFMRRSIDQKS